METAPRSPRRVVLLIAAVVCVLAAATAVYLLPSERPLDWSARDQWVAKSVRPTTLKGTFHNWRNLDFTISAQEEAAVKKCVELVKRIHYRIDDHVQFTTDDTRQQLETVLRQNPEFFYAEYLLATWHRLRGNASESNRYCQLAFAHAPRTLIQTYQFADGTPLANVEFQSIEIECNRVQNHSIDPSLILKFPALLTDAHGRVYLPVYNTVYRAASLPIPTGLAIDYPKLGWFEASRKASLLPIATVRSNP